jgi:hypothetical protein
VSPITIVDRHGKPGGYWNDAYSFVALHQPSAFYGVNSLQLGSGLKDDHGLNAGVYELPLGRRSRAISTRRCAASYYRVGACAFCQ